MTAVVLALVLSMTATVEAADVEPVRVLLVTGVDHPAHHWRKTASAVREVLEKQGRIEVRIVEDPAFLASDTLFDYDVLFLHFKNYEPLAREDRVRENLINFVTGGKGLVAMHFASGAFEKWPEYESLVGKVWDGVSSHDPKGLFTVKIADQEHPITKGLQNFATDDELYICLKGDRPVDLLATARSTITGKDHPMAFALHCGRGRVFHTALGHDAKAIQTSGTAELLHRGCLWVAARDPSPP
jgi:type 1 glutamine amidotransferase